MARQRLELAIRMPTPARRDAFDNTGRLAPTVRDDIVHRMTGSIVTTLTSYSNQKGEAGIRPRVRAGVEPERITMDMEVDMIDGVAQMEHNLTQFNLSAFNALVEMLFQGAVTRWEQKEYKPARLTMDGINWEAD